MIYNVVTNHQLDLPVDLETYAILVVNLTKFHGRSTFLTGIQYQYTGYSYNLEGVASPLLLRLSICYICNILGQVLGHDIVWIKLIKKIYTQLSYF